MINLKYLQLIENSKSGGIDKIRTFFPLSRNGEMVNKKNELIVASAIRNYLANPILNVL